MNKPTLPLAVAAATLLTTLAVLPGVASAQSGQAVINASANVRAGPASDYPVVAQAGPGMPVTVYGCVAGYSWCDIGLPGARGWIYGALLSYPYQGNPVPVLSYGTMIGLPIITFSIGSYWGNYYRNRPWYNDQRYWHRPPPGPRPPHWGPGPGPRPPGHGYYPGNPRPPGHGAGPGPRPPGHGAGPGPRPPGHGAGPGPRPPGHGGGQGPRPPGGGGNGGGHGGGHGGGNGGGHGGGHGGGRPPGGGPGGPNR
ncbi:SH3 domain-containing protein [Pandoraea commovens]|uniref:Peptide-binding protein n=1 Tax=Pandoraea commovens TaxID=2508289 RepID=A0A5E4VAF7_9BURK|nr:SH3 domain-containing protein [Pandoraea commovens]UVA78814.1 SH3 domain-containing protein [Pandoraea commovens]VVE09101.1 peptide-binding protein [Pandoraea commovens]